MEPICKLPASNTAVYQLNHMHVTDPAKSILFFPEIHIELLALTNFTSGFIQKPDKGLHMIRTRFIQVFITLAQALRLQPAGRWIHHILHATVAFPSQRCVVHDIVMNECEIMEELDGYGNFPGIGFDGPKYSLPSKQSTGRISFASVFQHVRSSP